MARIPSRPTRVARARNGEEPKASIEERLLAATERLLEKGFRFATLSISQLADEAGMARGTFYLHFRDKGELVARLMSHFTEEIVRSTGDWLQDAGESRPRDVQQAVVGIVRTFKKHQAILAAISDTAVQDENVAAQYRAMVETICARSRRSLATVKRKGRSRPGASNDVADVMSWMIVLYCARFVGEHDGKELDRLARSLGYIASSAAFADSA